MESTTNNTNDTTTTDDDVHHQSQPKPTANCPEENPLDSMNSSWTIQNVPFPPEVWDKIFGYLTHSEKLISRLVCNDWNREISSILARTSYFALTTRSSHETILDSAVHWTKVKIPGSLDYPCPDFALPTKTRSFITTVEFQVRGMIECMPILLNGFPEVTHLAVRLRAGNLPTLENSRVAKAKHQTLCRRFKKYARKLKKLTITFPQGKFEILSNALSYFNWEMPLAEFKIKENEKWVTDPEEGPCYMDAVYNVIARSRRTLFSLELDFVSRFIRKKLFAELVSKLTTLEDLKLETFLLYSDPTKEISNADFEIHQNFLKKQITMGGMKCFSLPWCSNAYLCQEFVLSLPTNITSVENVCKQHVSKEFYSTFSKCNTMTIRSYGLSMFDQPCPSIRQFHLEIKEESSREDFPYRDDGFYINLGRALINLVELHIVPCSVVFMFSDYELQLIIQNFRKIKILEIQSGSYISDFGVSGLEEEYAFELQETRKLYLCQDVEENRRGLPLSSLKCLEKLVLLGVSISDVGVYYGLRFGPKLKHLTLMETKDAKISDWGLYWLGEGNPGLDYFDGIFKWNDSRISEEGPENLRKQLPLLEATQKFKFTQNRRS